MPHKNISQATRAFVYKSLHGQEGWKFRQFVADFKTQSTCGHIRNVRSTRQTCQQFQNGEYTFHRLKSIIQSVNEKLNVLTMVFARQLNAIAAQRVRRTMQVMGLYNSLGYDSTLIKKVVEKFGNSILRHKQQPLSLLLAACLFSWKEKGISQQELDECVNEIHTLKGQSSAALPRDQESLGTQWEKVIDRENIVLWRRPRDNGYLYEYKVFGTYKDVPARDFFAIQTDLEYRRQWDKLIIDVGVVDRDEDSGCEVVQWVMHYPYPMYSRDYVYVRKCVVDTEKRVMVLMSRGIDHPKCPVNKKYVRVTDYMSHMVIKPHNSFDENGFDYILTYFDDPHAAIPSPAYKWMAATGVPDFVDKMAQVAKQLHENKKGEAQEVTNESLAM